MKRPKPPLPTGLSPLKPVAGPLPGIFNTMWDLKRANQITRQQQANPVLRRMLAERGYDVASWRKIEGE